MSRSNLMEKKRPIRSKQYHKACDEELCKKIKVIIEERSTYGYRRVTARLNGELRKENAPLVNHKKVYRIMKQKQLLLQKPNRKPERAHVGKVHTIQSNVRWCSDAFSIQCLNGEQLHVAFSIDTCDREVMRYVASTRGIDGKAIRDLMLETVEYRFGTLKVGHKVQWLTDNGSCYTARETVAFGKELGLEIRTTPVRSPESNGIAEAFVKTLKRDYAWLSNLTDAKAAMAQLPNWIEDYNERAPHKALGMQSPREFVKSRKNTPRTGPSSPSSSAQALPGERESIKLVS